MDAKALRLRHDGAAMTGPLAPKTDPNFRLEHVGREQQPVLIIDDCLADPGAVLAIAAKAHFARHGPHYPGIRAPVPHAACAILIDPLSAIIAKTFGLQCAPAFDECFLSVLTTAAKDLQPIQRLPHFDGLESDRLAFLLYLDRSEESGTAFYRHRTTGFETVDATRFAAFQSGLERNIRQHGMPASDYIRSDTGLYEQISAISGTFNRAIVYRGNSLHCAHLPEAFEPNPNPLEGRLTLNLFLRAGS